MKKVDPEASLERLLGILEGLNSDLLALVRAKTEQEFIAATEGGLDRAIRKIESGAKEYSKLDEPGLSHILADLLNCMGWHATAETNNNGHVDVIVEHASGKHWRYLGECKLHKGYQYHVDGCEQLLGYCTGRDSRAFCIDFFKKPGAFEKMSKMREEIDKQRPLKQKYKSLDHEISGAFLTSHSHDASGSAVEILHLACSVPKP